MDALEAEIREAVYSALGRFENGASVEECENWAVAEILEAIKNNK